MIPPLKLSQLNYSFPPELIALYPPAKRESSRMMVLDRKARTWEHHYFEDIGGYFKAGDILVLNDSRVFPCRLFTTKATGGKLECFLIREVSCCTWECLLTSSKKILEGQVLHFGPKLTGVVENGPEHDIRLIQLEYTGDIFSLLNEIGHVPLPPYIKRADLKDLDQDRYQTVYAREIGSVAAPTAGFHFTPEILDHLKGKEVEILFVTLHVGLGTFLPVRAEILAEHHMHGEFYDISLNTVQALAQAKKDKRRVTVVGTTAVRALESAWDGAKVKPGPNFTTQFIYPPYAFQVVDRLFTNFHQPQSTLLALVGAFAGLKEGPFVGLDFVLEAYREAIHHRYKLFSYGDCMLME
jgi:S-adenosylmethionine:tRNA ribosyltransferase-isomerase